MKPREGIRRINDMTLSGFLTRPLAALVLLPFILALAGCSQLGVFNAVVPKDGGAELAASGIAYGPDPRQRLDVYRPAEGNSQATVLFVYGGSWNSGRRQDYAFAAQALASRGYTTVVFDYRLVPQVRYPDFVHDTAAAVAWAQANIADHGGDPASIFLVGHSAGAYNAAMAALAPEFLRAAGVAPGSVKGVVGLSGPYDFLPLDVAATRAAFAEAPDLAATQPVNRVSRLAPPFLLMHGDADTLVLPRNMTALADGLENAGVAVRSLLLPGVDHAGTLLALSRPLRGRAPVLDEIDDFVSRNR
jgi:acetyl esterase/lipase